MRPLFKPRYSTPSMGLSAAILQFMSSQPRSPDHHDELLPCKQPMRFLSDSTLRSRQPSLQSVTPQSLQLAMMRMPTLVDPLNVESPGVKQSLTPSGRGV